ncbi:MAG: dTDP-4-dehydrorhamnose 3,5-epimerase [Parachlamydiales bacterium]|jgi:dTDP-4-dehydrorhamnose 3,5-epimerase
MAIQIIPTAIPDVLIIEHRIFGDERGFFYESFNEKEFREATGVADTFVQDNHSRSVKNVLRGLHFQEENPQGKLVRVSVGSVFDVAVDIRPDSPTFGQWISVILDDKKRQSLWIPKGLAHGFLVLSDVAEFLYKTTDYYNPKAEKTLRWDDPYLNITWPIEGLPSLSAKDSVGMSFSEIEALR